MPKFFHVYLLTLLLFLCVLRYLMLDKLLQLLYSNLVKFQLFLLFLQNQQLLLFFQSPLLEFVFNVLNFFIPAFFRLLSFLLKVGNLIFNLVDHFDSDNTGGLYFLPLLLAFLNFHFHLLYPALLSDILFMVFS